MAFTAEQIRNAWEDSLAQGFTPEQIYQGALANFGLSAAEVDAALSSTSGVNVQQMFVPQTVQTNIGQVSYDDLINQINSRYQEGKTPELAVKSALQLGIDPAIIANLPGVTPEALASGRNLISSGAFADTATGTSADTQRAAAVGSDQYNARLAAGLDPFGFPADEVAKLTAQGLYGPGKKYDPGTGTIATSNLADKFKAAADFLNSPENRAMAEAAATSQQITVDGKNYIVYPDGNAVLFENDRVKGFDQYGNVILDQTQQEYKKPGYLTPFVNAAKAALFGAVLGPAGSGLLGSTGAAAAGAGLGNLASGGDLQSALKSAALGGAAAYGAGSLFGSSSVPVDDFLKADVAQLAAQGIGEEQIAQILTQEGLSSQVINAVLDAQFGTSAPGSAKAVSEPSVPSGAEQTVNLTGQTGGSNLGLLAAVSPGLSAFVPSVGGTLPSIEVIGQAFKPDLSIPDTVAAAIPAITGGAVQQVGVQGSKLVSDPNSPASAALGSIIAGIEPSIPSATDKVEVTGQRPATDLSVPSAAAASLLLPAGINSTLTKPTEPVTRKEDSLFKPSDILKLLTLLGGSAAVSGAGSGGSSTVGSIPTSNPLNYNDDYYSRIQKYYNSYMPQYPRDVATPLKQWYENKYGA